MSALIDSDVRGQKALVELIENQTNAIFNDWEKRFIKDLMGKTYSKLPKHEKVCVNRLIGWLRGDD